jgi:hypothetical protein
VDVDGAAGGEGYAYKILTVANGKPREISGPYAAAVHFEPVADLDLSGMMPPQLMARHGDVLWGVSHDGHLMAFNLTDPESPTLLVSHDLSDWGLWLGTFTGPTRLLAGTFHFADGEWSPTPSSAQAGRATAQTRESEPPHEWDRELVLIALRGIGVAVIDISLPSSPSVQTVIPRDDPMDLDRFGNDILIACGTEGLEVWRLENDYGFPVTASYVDEFDPENPNMSAESVRVFGPEQVAAIFYDLSEDNPEDGLRILSWSNDHFQEVSFVGDCPPDYPVTCEGRTPLPWRIGDVSTSDAVLVLFNAERQTLVSCTQPSAPRFVATWANAIYYGAVGFMGGWRDGLQVGTLLPDGLLLRLGATEVYYPGDDYTRYWGGAELYRWRDGVGEDGFRFLGALTHHGFESADAFDMSPQGILRWDSGGETYVIMGWADIQENQEQSYRLTVYRYLMGSGVTETPDVVQGLPELPEEGAQLQRIWPNPASAGPVFFRLNLSRPGRVNAEIFDVQGRRVSQFARGWTKAGTVDLFWDGRNQSGDRVGSGIYFARFEVDGSLVGMGKVMILR